MNITKNITIAASIYAALLLGCTETNLTVAPSSVEVAVQGPGTSVSGRD